MNKEIICTVCPMGCRITVEGNDQTVQAIYGFSCKRGEAYGRQEFVQPMRVLTTTMKTDCPALPLVPVRSSDLLPRDKIMDCVDAIRTVQVKCPISIHQVLMENICGTGVDIIATAEINCI